jgi:hypothetical protein
MDGNFSKIDHVCILARKGMVSVEMFLTESLKSKVQEFQIRTQSF